MALHREDVARLADLARLNIGAEEANAMRDDLENILGFVDRLKEVDTEGVEPLTMPQKAEGWRTDAALPCDAVAREYILLDFPERKGDLLKTPGVFEKPKGGK